MEPVFDLTDFQSYQDYFEAIALDHKAIDGGFLLGDADVTSNEGRVWKGRKLWLEPYQPFTIEDQLSDNYLMVKKGSLWVGGSPSSQKYAVMHEYYRSCETIVRDIIGRMILDNHNAKLITRVREYRVGMGELLISSTQMIGCRFDFTFIDPSGFSYNTSVWKSED